MKKRVKKPVRISWKEKASEMAMQVTNIRSLYGAACTDNDRLIAENERLSKDNRALSALSQENDRLKTEIERLRNRIPVMPRSVDPTAEVVMLMKRSMESQISATDNLLDAMGELVDTVSGRKARRERDQERDPSIVDLER